MYILGSYVQNIVKKNKIVLFIIVISSVAIIEICLRTIGLGSPPVVNLHPKIEYYLKPNGEYSRFGNQISINRYGMRSDDYDLNNPRYDSIFIFGDSVVYGNHFLDQTETIAFQLQKRINMPNFKVSAVAASSWGPGNIKSFISEFGPFRGVSAIIVQSSHDRRDIPFSSTDIIPYRVQESRSAIDDVFQIIIERTKRKFRNQARNLTSEQAELRSDKSLREIILSAKNNFDQVILVHHVTKNELIKGNSQSLIYYQQLANELEINFCSTMTMYAKYSSPLLLYQDSIHLSKLGSEYFAQIIYKRLQLGESLRSNWLTP